MGGEEIMQAECDGTVMSTTLLGRSSLTAVRKNRA
jgi:hypothetical protein